MTLPLFDLLTKTSWGTTESKSWTIDGPRISGDETLAVNQEMSKFRRIFFFLFKKLVNRKIWFWMFDEFKYRNRQTSIGSAVQGQKQTRNGAINSDASPLAAAVGNVMKSRCVACVGVFCGWLHWQDSGKSVGKSSATAAPQQRLQAATGGNCVNRLADNGPPGVSMTGARTDGIHRSETIFWQFLDADTARLICIFKCVAPAQVADPSNFWHFNLFGWDSKSVLNFKYADDVLLGSVELKVAAISRDIFPSCKCGRIKEAQRVVFDMRLLEPLGPVELRMSSGPKLAAHHYSWLPDRWVAGGWRVFRTVSHRSRFRRWCRYDDRHIFSASKRIDPFWPVYGRVQGGATLKRCGRDLRHSNPNLKQTLNKWWDARCQTLENPWGNCASAMATAVVCALPDLPPPVPVTESRRMNK